MDIAAAPPAESSKASRRLLIGLIFVAIALNYVDRQVLALLKPTLEAEFGWSNRDYAMLGSAFQITAAASFLFTAWFIYVGYLRVLAPFVERFRGPGLLIAVGNATVRNSIAGA